jgi:hypothetical protein
VVHVRVLPDEGGPPGILRLRAAFKSLLRQHRVRIESAASVADAMDGSERK